MAEPISLDDLKGVVAALNLPVANHRLGALLPEVQRLLSQARRVRALSLEAEEPAIRFALE